VTALPQNNPYITLPGFTDAVSYHPGAVAPGEIYSLFGINFGPSTLTGGVLDASGKLGTSIAGTQVLFDGKASPLLYAVKGQVSGVAPFGLTGKTSTQVQVVSNALTSPAITVPVNASSLAINSANGSGGGGGVIINPDGSLNTPQNPAAVGSIVVIYASYGGPFANGVAGTDGQTTIAPPYPAPAGPVGVTIGGVSVPAADIQYFANAATFLQSVMQINVAIPAGVPSGAYVPITLTAGGATSQPGITIAVK
jgi:uncharacterized protein (TIGR03437 family)